MHDLIPIGAFAELSRLSQKALRLYDELGLLSPAHVDPETGYRFYAEEQLSRAKRIALLRGLKMPLASIRQVLDANPPAALDLVEEYWRGVEAWVADGAKVIEHLRRAFRGEETIMGYEVEGRTVDAVRVASTTRQVFIGDLGDFIHSSIPTILAYIRGHGATPVGAPMAIYHGPVNADSNGPVEIAVPFEGSLAGTEEIRIGEQRAMTMAVTRLTVRQVQFPEILGAYDALHAWVRGRGHRFAGPPREIYFAGREGLAPDDPFLDVAWPFEPAAVPAR